MNDVTATGEPPAIRHNFYAREVRFGVVMYGGVSLAIYINGVTNELYEMACATPRERDDFSIPGTRDVYRKASWLLRDERLRSRYLEFLNGTGRDPFTDMTALPGGQRTRFVVDTLAGTSAGGINGLFLAKALAQGQKFAPLKTLWVEEGDINRLLNDDASYEGLDIPKTAAPPQSLLNSDRMYVKLVDALKGMENVDGLVAEGASLLTDEIDLFITTTDIRGAIVPLRLFDKVVYEKRYKQVYHFQYPAADGTNHFDDSHIPFLAFAARCTSSFPFAFEPMTVNDAQRLCDVRQTTARVNFNDWKPFFTGLSAADMAGEGWRKRAFGDGGYLDNKPFSYVVDALSWRLGELPMERKLIYVEPAPADPELEPEDESEKPDALQNALSALLTIPLDETIREDLEAVLARNRRIERVERIVRQAETDIESLSDDPFARIELDEHGKVPAWRSRDLRHMVNYYGVAFLPYRHLRIMTVTDDIAERLAVWWDIDRRSDRLYALRALARAWREENFYEYETEKVEGQVGSGNAFLDDYDVKYRLRRTGFILRKVHQLRSLLAKPELPGDEDDWSDVEKDLGARWDKHVSSRGPMDPRALFAALDSLADWLGKAIAELRLVIWQLKPKENVDRAGLGRELQETLRVLLGEKPDADFRGLTTPSGAIVPLPAADNLPLPNPLRTLQENVFKRAKKLFDFAKMEEKTRLQIALEADIRELKDRYAPVIGLPEEAVRAEAQAEAQAEAHAEAEAGQDTEQDGNVPLPHAVLGNPKLVPREESDEGGPLVYVKVDNVTLTSDDTALNTPEGTAVRELLAEYFMRFDEYDQASFPLYYDTGTGEPSTVEVVRISPEDAASLINERSGTRRKLAGTAVFHFGAFLDEQWRRNDIMWGRLDGCERLLTIMFPAAEDNEVRSALLREAQLIIVREEMQPEAYGELIDRFGTLLAEQGNETLEGAFDDLWGKLALSGSGQRRNQIAQALKAVLGDQGMLNYVRDRYKVKDKPDTEAMLHTSARALTITGLILQQSEERYRIKPSRMVWLARAGRAFQVLLTVSTPGSLSKAVFGHWLGVLYAFEIFIVAGALLLSATTARTFGLTIFGVTFAIHMASLVTGDLIVGQRGWVKFVVFLLALAVLLLAGVGGAALYNGDFHAITCLNGQSSFGAVLEGWCSKQNTQRGPSPHPLHG